MSTTRATNKPVRVICDMCHKAFTVKQKSERMAEGVEHIYFQCPKCAHKYTMQISDKEIRELINVQGQPMPAEARTNDLMWNKWNREFEERRLLIKHKQESLKQRLKMLHTS